MDTKKEIIFIEENNISAAMIKKLESLECSVIVVKDVTKIKAYADIGRIGVGELYEAAMLTLKDHPGITMHSFGINVYNKAFAKKQ